jgi:hypothetical protein
MRAYRDEHRYPITVRCVSGQRFLMLKATEQAQTTQINLVLNWFEELKHRVQPGKK